ncbi:MAG: UvrD/REP helicase [Candidatus Saccharibacteria bacterium]|nr:UvrD/REP helicase [Candidatus Saccharibacteria bacterium]
MQGDFQTAYRLLNAKQKEAVDTIEGPLLVIAGPGTGKTQLLSTRAAKIVSVGTVAPSNILCLTYTETGASEMRARMGRVMGPNGGEVAVHTFHSFGSWLINQYSEQFSAERALQPLDDLGRFTLLESLLKRLPFRHQLAIRDENERFIRQHGVEEAIRAFKQAGLTPKALRQQIKQNETEYAALQPMLDELFASNLSAKRLDSIAALIKSYQQKAEPLSYSDILLNSLSTAVSESQAAGKTAVLGKWRDKHTTIKDKKRVLKSAAQNTLLKEVVGLYEAYQKQLVEQGRFDYEDMILWAANALETNDDMRLDIAERFQYIMVDEYQDTNGAQNRLLDSLLRANPLDAPNVMVVGDDDQAIMRFQGAEVSGMLRFIKEYQPKIIALEDNYRSSQIILDASRQVMVQTEERLEVSLPDGNFSKVLTAQAERPKTTIEHAIYASPSAEYAAVASYVEKQLASGVPANEIGVIGRKHAELAAFVPFLTARGISINYDRRENILDHPAILQLLQLARYVATLAEKPLRAQLLLPQVLAADYWQLQPTAIYQLAARAKQDGQSWLDTMLADDAWKDYAEWLLAAASASQTRNFTQMLDILIGRENLDDTALKQSPFARLYTNQPPELHLSILSHLIRLRGAVLDNRPTATGIKDLLDVTDQYRQSDIRLLDDNPLLRGDSDSVQVMSAHGAKGREFEHVIILSAVDEVWGNRARSNNQRIFLPENLPLYSAGDAESDKLRLLYVAMTRAKSQLLLASYAQSDSGKASTPLSFFMLGDDAGWWQGSTQDSTPEDKRTALEHAWRPVSRTQRDLQHVLEPLLKNYRLSATALRDFIDFRYAGPIATIEKHVLRFPSTYNAHSALGSASHRVLQVAHAAYRAGKPLTDTQLLKTFDETLDASGLSEHELSAVRDHAHQFLPLFVRQFSASDFDSIIETEQFLSALSPSSQIPLSGAIDALATDGAGLRVIDYKTGRPPLPDWETKGLSDSKKVSLHFYRQQLLFYKLLVDNSILYRGKQLVTCAQLVFVENSDEKPDEFIRLDITDFTTVELTRTERLMKIIYRRITQADLPDTGGYSQDLKGILAFEEDLLSD